MLSIDSSKKDAAKIGPCPLCCGKNAGKEKKLLRIEGTYAGFVCLDHLWVLVEQAPKTPAVE